MQNVSNHFVSYPRPPESPRMSCNSNPKGDPEMIYDSKHPGRTLRKCLRLPQALLQYLGSEVRLGSLQRGQVGRLKERFASARSDHTDPNMVK
ncbi:hypothetical protein NPIL_473651 [Nephila pilipes]|uniref:Uncharacterized protein n=1 Tax=Nephila pilipes TaxID=299642 RepID=A0A8X6N218_NEPPI|nr:hypothetical protein NPIL_473651 [Nephila pilipes]